MRKGSKVIKKDRANPATQNYAQYCIKQIITDLFSTDKTVLIVSEKGCVEGDVKGPVVIINGQVEGDVTSTQTLELAQHAKVKGNVYYNLLEMEVGAQVNGSLIHEEVSTAKIKSKLAEKSVSSGQDEATLTAGSR